MRKTDNKTQLSRRDFIKITAVAGSVLIGGKWISDLIKDEIVTVKETRLLMGTVINLAVVSECRAAGETAIAATFAELERQVAIFNHREPHSSVAVLNSMGRLAKPPQELVEILMEAIHISEITDGAFDISVKPLVDLYLTTQPDLPTAETVADVLRLVDYRQLKITNDEISLSQPGMAITLDGIAKGYVVDAGVAELRNLGFANVFVEAGGDLMALGEKEAETAWKVGVQSPRASQEGLLASFNVKDQAVATSGDYMQYFSKDMRYHHILDPSSGYSAPYLASATVVAPTCAQADALATTLMVMKPEDGLAMTNSIDNIDALLIAKDLEEYRSSGFKDR